MTGNIFSADIRENRRNPGSRLAGRTETVRCGGEALMGDGSGRSGRGCVGVVEVGKGEDPGCLLGGVFPCRQLGFLYQ